MNKPLIELQATDLRELGFSSSGLVFTKYCVNAQGQPIVAIEARWSDVGQQAEATPEFVFTVRTKIKPDAFCVIEVERLETWDKVDEAAMKMAEIGMPFTIAEDQEAARNSAKQVSEARAQRSLAVQQLHDDAIAEVERLKVAGWQQGDFGRALKDLLGGENSGI